MHPPRKLLLFGRRFRQLPKQRRHHVDGRLTFFQIPLRDTQPDRGNYRLAPQWPVQFSGESIAAFGDRAIFGHVVIAVIIGGERSQDAERVGAVASDTSVDIVLRAQDDGLDLFIPRHRDQHRRRTRQIGAVIALRSLRTTIVESSDYDRGGLAIFATIERRYTRWRHGNAFRGLSNYRATDTRNTRQHACDRTMPDDLPAAPHRNPPIAPEREVTPASFERQDCWATPSHATDNCRHRPRALDRSPPPP